MSNNQQRRMKDRTATSKPRVYKQRADGMWWADARDGQTYKCDVFFTHAEALAKAAKYAAGVFE